MTARTLLITLLLAGIATPVGAATDEQKCHSKKLKLAGVHAACRQKADAKAILKGTPPDYAKCDEALASKFAKTEEKAGPGICPSENDADAIQAILEESARRVSERLTAPDPSCPPNYRDRTPGEVVSDWLLAYGSGNATLFLCNYHPGASVTADQGVLVGHADILFAYQSLWELFNGVSPFIIQQTEFQNTVGLLFSLDAGWVEIEDGVDSFLIEEGRIRRQWSHGLITFNGPPPDQN